MKIPSDPDGYSVDDSGGIHTRYSTHSGRHDRTRTTKGVETLLAGKKGWICPTCFPTIPPRSDDTPRPPQQRRSGKT